MKQRYQWEVRVGGVLLTLKVERVGGIKQKKQKRNNVTRVEKRERERASALVRAIIQQTI